MARIFSAVAMSVAGNVHALSANQSKHELKALDSVVAIGMDLTLPAEERAVHFTVGGALCGEVAVSSALASPVKAVLTAVLKDFQDGYCADAGESIQQINTLSFAGVKVSAFVGNFAGDGGSGIDLTLSAEESGLFDCNIYRESDDYGIPCGEVNLGCQWVPLANLFTQFKSGKCADAGYTMQAHAWQTKFPIFGDFTFAMYETTQPSTKQCSVSLPAGFMCGEVKTSCDLIPTMKAFFTTLSDGGCSTDSYKLVPGATGTYFEDFTFSGYVDKSVDIPEMSGNTCTVYDEGGDWATKQGVPCGQMSLDCALVPNAKMVRETFKDGVCADAGYTQEKESLWARTLWVPLAGDIVLKVFDKTQIQQIQV